MLMTVDDAARTVGVTSDVIYAAIGAEELSPCPFDVKRRDGKDCILLDGSDVLEWHSRRNGVAADPAPKPAPEAVDHPPHYNEHPSGVECIDIVEHMGFCLGNAIKYIWRADLKADALEDLKKARWYLDREIARREGGTGVTPGR